MYVLLHVCVITVLKVEHRSRCFVLLDPEDSHYKNGDYTKSLDRIGWKDNIVVGLTGHEKQVLFADCICPMNSHVVIVDDNVVDLEKLAYDSTGSTTKVIMHCGGLSELLSKAKKEMANTGYNVIALITFV